MYIHVLMRDERRKEERSKLGQTNNKAKQHSTPKAVAFPELPQVGMYMYMYMYISIQLHSEFACT